MRWSEEVRLLQEEMRRVLAYHEWHADWWELLAFAKTGLSPDKEEGSVAYAYRQASIRLALREECQRLWANVDAFVAGSVGISALAQ